MKLLEDVLQINKGINWERENKIDLSVAEELEPESAALGLKSLWEVDV